MLIAAVPPTYLAILRHRLMIFATVSTYSLLNHLTTTYGAIDANLLTNNAKALDVDWNPDSPIEDLWVHVNDCCHFAEVGGDPISEARAVRDTVQVLLKTGVFIDAMKDWEALEDDSKTWARLVLLFTKANKLRKKLLTAKTAGFHGAHLVTTSATTTETSTIPPVSVATACSATTQASTTVSAITQATTPHHNQPGWHFCWTHGLSRSSRHTSATCINKAVGHITTATIENMQGGNNCIQRQRGEQPAPPRCPATSEPAPLMAQRASRTSNPP